MTTHIYEHDGMRFDIPDGLTEDRVALFLSNKFTRNKRDLKGILVGFYPTCEAAKSEAGLKFPDFRPGVAMVVDCETGEILRGDNYITNQDSIIWTVIREGKLRHGNRNA